VAAARHSLFRSVRDSALLPMTVSAPNNADFHIAVKPGVKP
jgi:hypothetical protein